MKNLSISFANWFNENYKFVVLSAFFLGFYIPISSKSEQLSKSLKAKEAELANLRLKIDNHLIANKFYSKPASEVVPVLKDFGLVK